MRMNKKIIISPPFFGLMSMLVSRDRYITLDNSNIDTRIM